MNDNQIDWDCVFVSGMIRRCRRPLGVSTGVPCLHRSAALEENAFFGRYNDAPPPVFFSDLTSSSAIARRMRRFALTAHAQGAGLARGG